VKLLVQETYQKRVSTIEKLIQKMRLNINEL
jgi:hypothetical protein